MLFVGLVAIANLLLSSSMSLMPLLVFKGYAGDAGILGWFQSASGFGMIAGGLALGLWGGPRRKIPAFLACVVGVGAFLWIPAWTPAARWPIAVGGLGLLGVTFAIAQGTFSAATRGLVDPAKQGRFYALLGSLLQALEPLGIMIAGVISDAVSIRFWFAVAGGILIVAATAGFLCPPLRRIEQEADEVRAQSIA